MPIYRPAGPAVQAKMCEIMDAHHRALIEAEASVLCLFAKPSSDKNAEASEPCLRHAGYPAQAIAKIVSQRDRACGMPDALIIIDEWNWGQSDVEEWLALLDHELTHLEVVVDDEAGQVKLDACERPLLKIRKHDHQYGFFDDVAKRHKEHSYEVQSVVRLLEGPSGQYYLPGLSPTTAQAARRKRPQGGTDKTL